MPGIIITENFQKVPFQVPKGGVLHAKRRHFGTRKGTSCKILIHREIARRPSRVFRKHEKERKAGYRQGQDGVYLRLGTFINTPAKRELPR